MHKGIKISGMVFGACLVGEFAFLSCGKPRSGYYPKDQWIVPNKWYRNPLKSKPLEVKESLFLMLGDSTLAAKGKPNSWELYRFDRDGNMSYKKTFYTDSMWSEIFFHDDSAGQHAEVVSHIISITTHDLPQDSVEDMDRSTLLPNGKIMVIKGRSRAKILLNPNLQLPANLTSFSDKGNIKKVEWMKDTSGNGEPNAVVTSYYDGQKLKKIDGKSEKEHVILQYYYSAHDFLDSIISDSAGKTYERQLYVNNSFGDPIRYLNISGGSDTIEEFTNRYEYDKSGNWTKRLEKRIFKGEEASTIMRVGGPFTLFVREIVYPGDNRTP